MRIAVSGKDVKPAVAPRPVPAGPIALSGGFRALARGNSLSVYMLLKDVITSDGTTLLGADDAAEVAEIMTVAQTLLSDPSIPHGGGPDRLFTPVTKWATG